MTFDVDVRILAYHDADMRLVVSPGDLELMAGGSSADLPLVTHVTVTGEAARFTRRTVFLTECRIEKAVNAVVAGNRQ